MGACILAITMVPRGTAEDTAAPETQFRDRWRYGNRTGSARRSQCALHCVDSALVKRRAPGTREPANLSR